jgi:hypothetical protein
MICDRNKMNSADLEISWMGWAIDCSKKQRPCWSACGLERRKRIYSAMYWL